MIKVSVMYPNTPGARFDHAYYRDKHMPLLKARMGASCKSYTVDKGLAGGAPGSAGNWQPGSRARPPSRERPRVVQPTTTSLIWITGVRSV